MKYSSRTGSPEICPNLEENELTDTCHSTRVIITPLCSHIYEDDTLPFFLWAMYLPNCSGPKGSFPAVKQLYIRYDGVSISPRPPVLSISCRFIPPYSKAEMCSSRTDSWLSWIYIYIHSQGSIPSEDSAIGGIHSHCKKRTNEKCLKVFSEATKKYALVTNTAELTW